MAFVSRRLAQVLYLRRDSSSRGLRGKILSSFARLLSSDCYSFQIKFRPPLGDYELGMFAKLVPNPESVGQCLVDYVAAMKEKDMGMEKPVKTQATMVAATAA